MVPGGGRRPGVPVGGVITRLPGRITTQAYPTPTAPMPSYPSQMLPAKTTLVAQAAPVAGYSTIPAVSMPSTPPSWMLPATRTHAPPARAPVPAPVRNSLAQAVPVAHYPTTPAAPMPSSHPFAGTHASPALPPTSAKGAVFQAGNFIGPAISDDQFRKDALARPPSGSDSQAPPPAAVPMPSHSPSTKGRVQAPAPPPQAKDPFASSHAVFPQKSAEELHLEAWGEELKKQEHAKEKALRVCFKYVLAGINEDIIEGTYRQHDKDCMSEILDVAREEFNSGRDILLNFFREKVKEAELSPDMVSNGTPYEKQLEQQLHKTELIRGCLLLPQVQVKINGVINKHKSAIEYIDKLKDRDMVYGAQGKPGILQHKQKEISLLESYLPTDFKEKVLEIYSSEIEERKADFKQRFIKGHDVQDILSECCSHVRTFIGQELNTARNKKNAADKKKELEEQETEYKNLAHACVNKFLSLETTGWLGKYKELVYNEDLNLDPIMKPKCDDCFSSLEKDLRSQFFNEMFNKALVLLKKDTPEKDIFEEFKKIYDQEISDTKLDLTSEYFMECLSEINIDKIERIMKQQYPEATISNVKVFVKKRIKEGKDFNELRDDVLRQYKVESIISRNLPLWFNQQYDVYSSAAVTAATNFYETEGQTEGIRLVKGVCAELKNKNIDVASLGEKEVLGTDCIERKKHELKKEHKAKQVAIASQKAESEAEEYLLEKLRYMGSEIKNDLAGENIPVSDEMIRQCIDKTYTILFQYYMPVLVPMSKEERTNYLEQELDRQKESIKEEIRKFADEEFRVQLHSKAETEVDRALTGIKNLQNVLTVRQKNILDGGPSPEIKKWLIKTEMGILSRDGIIDKNAEMVEMIKAVIKQPQSNPNDKNIEYLELLSIMWDHQEADIKYRTYVEPLVDKLEKEQKGGYLTSFQAKMLNGILYGSKSRNEIDYWIEGLGEFFKENLMISSMNLIGDNGAGPDLSDIFNYMEHLCGQNSEFCYGLKGLEIKLSPNSDTKKEEIEEFFQRVRTELPGYLTNAQRALLAGVLGEAGKWSGEEHEYAESGVRFRDYLLRELYNENISVEQAIVNVVNLFRDYPDPRTNSLVVFGSMIVGDIEKEPDKRREIENNIRKMFTAANKHVGFGVAGGYKGEYLAIIVGLTGVSFFNYGGRYYQKEKKIAEDFRAKLMAKFLLKGGEFDENNINENIHEVLDSMEYDYQGDDYETALRNLKDLMDRKDFKEAMLFGFPNLSDSVGPREAHQSSPIFPESPKGLGLGTILEGTGDFLSSLFSFSASGVNKQGPVSLPNSGSTYYDAPPAAEEELLSHFRPEQSGFDPNYINDSGSPEGYDPSNVLDPDPDLDSDSNLEEEVSYVAPSPFFNSSGPTDQSTAPKTTVAPVPSASINSDFSDLSKTQGVKREVSNARDGWKICVKKDDSETGLMDVPDDQDPYKDPYKNQEYFLVKGGSTEDDYNTPECKIAVDTRNGIKITPQIVGRNPVESYKGEDGRVALTKEVIDQYIEGMVKLADIHKKSGSAAKPFVIRNGAGNPEVTRRLENALKEKGIICELADDDGTRNAVEGLPDTAPGPSPAPSSAPRPGP